jgi:hypothetical protein
MRETPSKEVEYHAYGKVWKYYTVERYTKRWGFNTPHGLIGERESLEQFVYLITGSGEKISVHEAIYALQKDGSYKKVQCCDNPLTQAGVYNADDKLILYFEQVREKTTDCFVHPSGYPDDEKEPDLDKRKRYVTLFGEFDSEKKNFQVREFLPGFSSEQFRSRLGNRPTKEQTIKFYYEKRKSFVCN